MRTELQILSLYRNIRVREHLYSGIFYAVLKLEICFYNKPTNIGVRFLRFCKKLRYGKDFLPQKRKNIFLCFSLWFFGWKLDQNLLDVNWLFSFRYLVSSLWSDFLNFILSFKTTHLLCYVLPKYVNIIKVGFSFSKELFFLVNESPLKWWIMLFISS